MSSPVRFVSVWKIIMLHSLSPVRVSAAREEHGGRVVRAESFRGIHHDPRGLQIYVIYYIICELALQTALARRTLS